MRAVFASTLSALALAPLALRAAPAPLFGFHFGAGQEANGAPTPVAQSDVDTDLLRPAQFARLAYCSAAAVTAMNCGDQCDAVQGISVLQAGGDDGKIPGCELLGFILSSKWWKLTTVASLHRDRPDFAERRGRPPGHRPGEDPLHCERRQVQADYDELYAVPVSGW